MVRYVRHVRLPSAVLSDCRMLSRRGASGSRTGSFRPRARTGPPSALLHFCTSACVFRLNLQSRGSTGARELARPVRDPHRAHTIGCRLSSPRIAARRTGAVGSTCRGRGVQLRLRRSVGAVCDAVRARSVSDREKTTHGGGSRRRCSSRPTYGLVVTPDVPERGSVRTRVWSGRCRSVNGQVVETVDPSPRVVQKGAR